MIELKQTIGSTLRVLTPGFQPSRAQDGRQRQRRLNSGLRSGV